MNTQRITQIIENQQRMQIAVRTMIFNSCSLEEITDNDYLMTAMGWD